MRSRYEATLNGIKLSSISPKILIEDISYTDPSLTFGTYYLAGRDGQRITREYKQKASATITFSVREYDTKQRQSIIQSVISWARDGGTLETSDRANQFLVCKCERKPYITSVLKWADAMQMTFTAYILPYWQNSSESKITLTGLQGSGNLNVPGSAPQTFVYATAKTNAAITYLSLEAGSTKMELKGLTVAANRQIVLDYTDDMVLRVRDGGTSLLNKRFGSDDLIADCGGATRVRFSADGNCTVEFKARGLWE